MPEFAEGGAIKGPNPSPDSVPLLLCGGYCALPASVAERHTSILAQINASKWGVSTMRSSRLGIAVTYLCEGVALMRAKAAEYFWTWDAGSM